MHIYISMLPIYKSKIRHLSVFSVIVTNSYLEKSIKYILTYYLLFVILAFA